MPGSGLNHPNGSLPSLPAWDTPWCYALHPTISAQFVCTDELFGSLLMQCLFLTIIYLKRNLLWGSAWCVVTLSTALTKGRCLSPQLSCQKSCPARVMKDIPPGISDTCCPQIPGIYYGGKGRQKLQGKQKSRSASGYYKLRIDRRSQLPVAKQPRELFDHALVLLKRKHKAESCVCALGGCEIMCERLVSMRGPSGFCAGCVREMLPCGWCEICQALGRRNNQWAPCSAALREHQMAADTGALVVLGVQMDRSTAGQGPAAPSPPSPSTALKIDVIRFQRGNEASGSSVTTPGLLWGCLSPAPALRWASWLRFRTSSGQAACPRHSHGQRPLQRRRQAELSLWLRSTALLGSALWWCSLIRLIQ